VDGFQWDDDKAAENIRKHGIDFADAVGVLYDEYGLTVLEEHDDEQRYVTIGLDALGRVLVVVYCWRDDDVRLISARPATSAERKQYEGNR